MLILTFIFAIGCIFGSFLGAWTYRLPRKISINKGRSFCPKCKNVIFWYDNIPLLSFLLLGGKCRACRKKISLREPLIEICTGITFSLLFYVLVNCGFSSLFISGLICDVGNSLGFYAIPYFGLVAFFLIAIFVIDLEHKLIPDEFAFLLYLFGLVLIIFTNPDGLYVRLLLGTLSALFILSLHLVTKGRGMGLGDVKLVLFAPLILASWQAVVIWLMLSFIIGAVFGVFMLIVGKAKMGSEIPFGPFLILSFVIVLLFSDKITPIVFGNIFN